MAVTPLNATAEIPVLLTIRETSAILRISHSKLYDLIRAGQLDTIKIGRRRLIPCDALIELVEDLRGETF